jgi:putative ABC transport system substrate-binding protein
MRRREFILFLGQAATGFPFVAQAQQTGRTRRVGLIIQGGPHYAGLAGLRMGFKALGLEEGQEVTLVVRDTKGDLKAAEAVAAELERDGVEVLVSFGMSATLAVKRATQTVPMVYVGGTDPVAGGLAASVSKPGGRVTGVHHLIAELTPKRLEIFRELVPTLRRVISFYNPENPAARQAVAAARDAARLLQIELIERQVTSPEELRKQVSELEAAGADGFFFIGDTTIGGRDQIIIDTANRLRLPTMAPEPDRVVRGALAAYGVNYRELGRLAAGFVSRILNGEQPGNLPIEDISVPALAINLKTAKAIGVEVPPDLLARAEEVID